MNQSNAKQIHLCQEALENVCKRHTIVFGYTFEKFKMGRNFKSSQSVGIQFKTTMKGKFELLSTVKVSI